MTEVIRDAALTLMEGYQGANLWHVLHIGVPDAVLGTTASMPALDGQVQIPVPPGQWWLMWKGPSAGVSRVRNPWRPPGSVATGTGGRPGM